MIMENYHQSDDELYHNAKSVLRQSNHYIDGVDEDHKHNLQRRYSTLDDPVIPPICMLGQALTMWGFM